MTDRSADAFAFARLHHVQLAVPPGAEEECRRYWGGVLGLTELDKPPVLAARGGCWFRGGGLEVHLGVEEDFTPARKAHPGILVDGLPALAARLEAAGMPVIWDGEFPGHERFYSADPLGNRLEFMEPHRAPAELDAPVLQGSLVRLEPLGPEHVADLARAAEEDRRSYGYTLVPRGTEVAAYVAAQRARTGLTPYAQVRLDDRRAVGCTGLWDPRPWPDGRGLRAIEIGFTWLAASAQGTGINTEAKLLLLTHAFETLGVARADLKTDARNARSRRAMERLGIPFEGVLRNWSVSWAPGEDGALRDSAMFAVTAGDWPRVKASIAERVRAR